MRAAPVNTQFQANKRVIVASFAAGIGAMLFIGLLAPVVARGGLSLASAEAHPFEQAAPVLAPLDVAAVQATLAEAERSMDRNRQLTQNAMNRLERLASR